MCVLKISIAIGISLRAANSVSIGDYDKSPETDPG